MKTEINDDKSKSRDLKINSPRKLPQKIETLLIGVGALLGLWVILYVGGFMSYLGIYILPGRVAVIVLMFGMASCYLMYPATKSDESKTNIPWYDWIAFLACILVNAHIFINWHDVERLPSILDSVLGTLTVLLILEAVRRAVSPVLSVLGLLFAIYPLITNFMPAFLSGRSFSFERVVTLYYMYGEGIYGSALILTSRIILVFLIFGSFLTLSGAGNFFLDLSLALFGHVRGGPAKVAVIGSALLGMINGSSAANAATSGVITIPLMEKVGYRPSFAAAVEAVASNGGQMMPPVMGFVAFLMVDFLQIPYIDIVKSGFLIGFLYFICVLAMVDFEAAKTGLKGVPREELPTFKKVFMDGWFYLIPIIVLIFFLVVLQFSPESSCIYATFTLIGVSFFKKKIRIGPKKIVQGLFNGVRILPDIGNVVALAGILIAAINLTGVGVRMTGGILDIAGGSLFILLLLTGITAIILGMGLPSIGIYILCAMLLTPAIEAADQRQL